MIVNTLPRSLLDNQLLDQWLSFSEPGRVKVATGKVELGQGVLTALAQIAADELDVALSRIDLASGDTHATPNEGYTAGSQSIEIGGASLRLAAAHARHLFLEAAAARLGRDASQLAVADGDITLDGKSTGLSYWALSNGVDFHQPVSGDVPTKPAAAYRIVGKSIPRLDLAAGPPGGRFIHDLELPEMRHARVVHQGFRGADLAFDEPRFRARHPDVTLVRRASFLALVADREDAAVAAWRDAVALARWQEPESGPHQPALPAERRTTLGEAAPAERVVRTVRARYARPFLAHASIGPSCGLALDDGQELRVWTQSQGVYPLRQEIARVLGREPERVRVSHLRGAGCYGHNGADDAAFDAAIIAEALPGTPIRVQWMREDELTHAPFGPAMEAELAADLDESGRIVNWTMRAESAPHGNRPGSMGQVNLLSAEALDRRHLPARVDDLPDAAGGGASRNALPIYDLPHLDVAVRLTTEIPLRTSSLRALGAHLNVFAIESFMDELAEATGQGPLAFRLAHLKDPRARAVLEEAALMAGWRDEAETGTGAGLGLAVARYKGKGAWLAAAAEVSVDENVRVRRLWCAVDAGLVINPAGAENQILGGAVQAVSWTLKEAVPHENGRVAALTWSDYPILRFSDVPEVQVRFIPSAAPSLGVGEAAHGPVAAAIANGVARALGQRVREMPFTRERILACSEGSARDHVPGIVSVAS